MLITIHPCYDYLNYLVTFPWLFVLVPGGDVVFNFDERVPTILTNSSISLVVHLKGYNWMQRALLPAMRNTTKYLRYVHPERLVLSELPVAYLASQPIVIVLLRQVAQDILRFVLAQSAHF